MCKNLKQGGKRCAAHTGPKFHAATFGTLDWDRAAADYASTPTGRAELDQARQVAETAGDLDRAVALGHALAEGERISEAVVAFRDAMATHEATAATTEPTVAEVPRNREEMLARLQQLGTELGFTRATVRADSTTTGVVSFQSFDRTHEVGYECYRDAFALRVRADDSTETGLARAGRCYDQFTGRWEHPAQVANALNAVRDNLTRKAPTKPENVAAALPPANREQLEAEFHALGAAIGYESVTTVDRFGGMAIAEFRRAGRVRRIPYAVTPDGFRLSFRSKPHGYGDIPSTGSGRISYYDQEALVLTAQWDRAADVKKALDVAREILSR